MSPAQQRMLAALHQHGPAGLTRLAKAAGQGLPQAQRTLDALYRRNLATIAPTRERWQLTARGQRKHEAAA